MPRPTLRMWNPRRVLIAIGLFWLVAMSVGAGYTYLHRHDSICRDNLPPVSQRDYGLGQVQFRCRNGQIVTKP